MRCSLVDYCGFQFWKDSEDGAKGYKKLLHVVEKDFKNE